MDVESKRIIGESLVTLKHPHSLQESEVTHLWRFKSETSGIYYKKTGKVSGHVKFLDTYAHLHTHQEFLSRFPSDFHVIFVALKKVVIEMISDISFDYLHLSIFDYSINLFVDNNNLLKLVFILKLRIFHYK